MPKQGPSTALPTYPSAHKILYHPTPHPPPPPSPSPTTNDPPPPPKHPQPKVSPIANLASPANAEPRGSLLDVNSSYIAYGVKNGLVRVINSKKYLRTLLRGHSSRVTDVKFFGGEAAQTGSHMLGTVGGEGDGSCVLVWRIFEGVDGSAVALKCEKLLEVRLRPAVRIVWHPLSPNQFILLHRRRHDGDGADGGDGGDSDRMTVVATCVETTKLKTATHPTEHHAVCLCESPPSASPPDDHHPADTTGQCIHGAVQLVVRGHPSRVGIHDLCWSTMDPRHVLTAHNDGCVRLWDITTRVLLHKPGAQMNLDRDGNLVMPHHHHPDVFVSADCLFTLRVTPDKSGHGQDDDDDGSVQQCMFLSAFDTASTDTQTTTIHPSSFATRPFITVTKRGSEVTLWSPFLSSSKQNPNAGPNPIRVFRINDTAPVPPPGRHYLVSSCTLPNPPPSPNNTNTNTTNHSSGTFILFGDNTEGNIYALHLSSTTTPKQHTIATGFDYIVPFRAIHPIYSWTLRSSPAGFEGGEGEEDGAYNIDLFCVQSKAVQLLTLVSSMCVGPGVSLDEEGGELPCGVEVVEVGGGGKELKDNPRESSSSNGDDNDNNEHVTEEEEEEEYEVYDEEDEEYECSSSGSEDEDCTDTAVSGIISADSNKGAVGGIDTIICPPPSSSVPLPVFGGSGEVDPSTANSFANWLGNLAAMPSNTTTTVPLPPPPMGNKNISGGDDNAAVDGTAHIPTKQPPPKTKRNNNDNDNNNNHTKNPSVSTKNTTTTPSADISLMTMPLPNAPSNNNTPPAAPVQILSSSANDPADASTAVLPSEKKKKQSPPRRLLSPVELLSAASIQKKDKEKEKDVKRRSSPPPSSRAAQQQQQQQQQQQNQQPVATVSKIMRPNPSAAKSTQKDLASQSRSQSAGRNNKHSTEKQQPRRKTPNKKQQQHQSGGAAGSSNTPQKLSILKKDDKTLTPMILDSSNNGNAKDRDNSAAASTALSLRDIESTVQKSVSTYFAKHEAAMIKQVHHAIHTEIQSTVLPQLTKSITQSLEDSIPKLINTSLSKQQQQQAQRSKNNNDSLNTDKLAKALSKSLDGTLHKTFEDTLRTAIVPAYESGTRQMFSQISDALERHAVSQTQADAASKHRKEMDQLSERTEALSKTVHVLIEAVGKLSVQHLSKNDDQQVNNPSSVSAPNAAPGLSLPDNKAPIDPTILLREKIKANIESDNYENAFTQALSASNSSVAVFACRHSNIEAVLGGATPLLSQPILLCLMQQLGAQLAISKDDNDDEQTDEGDDVMLVLAWLQNIAVSLDVHDDSISRHAGSVCRQLTDNIDAKMATADLALKRPLQMLLQVIRGIGHF